MEYIKLQISDTGTSIFPEMIESFFSVNYNTLIGSLNAEGAGIALHLVKAFTQLNGDTISCASQVNQGTQFTLEFPA